MPPRISGCSSGDAFELLERTLDNRQLDREPAALAVRRGHGERSAHCLGEATGQSKPDAGSLDVTALGAESLERHEQMLEIFGADTRSGVADVDTQLTVVRRFAGQRRRSRLRSCT